MDSVTLRRSWLPILLAGLLGFAAPRVQAAEMSNATLEVIGFVPTLFSISAAGTGQVMDLQRGVSISRQMIGMLHIAHNIQIASISVLSSNSSSTPGTEGLPVNTAGNAPEGLQLANLSFTFGDANGSCNAFTPETKQGTDIVAGGASPEITAITAAVNGDDYCPIFVNYQTSNTVLSTPGLYLMGLTLTMTSV